METDDHKYNTDFVKVKMMNLKPIATYLFMDL